MFSPVAAILYTGATPVFVDSDPHSWTIDVTQIARKITKRTRAILAVHIYGHPADMDSLRKIAKNHKLFLIEDAAEGLGALYLPAGKAGKGKKVGTLSDIACFSLYANKLVTTGEGGMVVTDNARLFRKIKSLADMAYHPKKRFLHTDLGFTYRMSNMQAAVGLSYLEEIEKTIQKKRHIAALYDKLLADLPMITRHQSESWATPVWWMYGIILNTSSPISREELRNKLITQGIDTRDFFVPCHRQPALRKVGLRVTGRFPVAEMLSRQGLYLPSGPAITDREIRIVCQTIQNIYANV
jgi:perosamine synthetase